MDEPPIEKQQPKIVDAIQSRGESTAPFRGVPARDAQSEMVKRIAQEKKLPPFRPEKQGTFPRGIVWGILVLVLMFVVSFGYFMYVSLTNRFSQSVQKNIDTFQSGVLDLKNLDPQSAGQKFSAANNDLNLTFGGFLSHFGLLFEGTKGLVLGFQKLTAESAELTQEMAFFKNNLLGALGEKKGDALIAHLENTERILGDLSTQSDALSSGVSRLQTISSSSINDAYLPLRLSLAKLQKFLAILIPWLKSDSPRHILVLFQNPSEIRPAGGFLGSYADIVLDKASVASIEVHDINDADRLLDLKVIPPQPLQAEVSRLRAADANWFFDWSKSAAEVTKLIEASKLYGAASTTLSTSSSTTFDAAIAVSPKIIGDLLHLTGPVIIKDARVTLDENNFLVEIQRQVQLGQAVQATYPKNILRELSSELMAQIAAFDDTRKQQLLRAAGQWLTEKDTMFYFKDPDLENFFKDFNSAGTVYAPGPDFEGDYLALVDANAGGGKSDLYIKQDVTLASQINASGTVVNHLVVDREHGGNASPYWWYKTPNLDYLQIFLPDASQLINFSGGIDKKIYPAVNYAKNGYTTDPLIAEVESGIQKVFNYPAVTSHEESGKEVFATWSSMKAGEKKEIIFDYSHRLFLSPTEGTEYQFVFEKQAGTSRHYKFTVSAPVGFKFKENDLPVYEYESDDATSSTNRMPGRLIINLTLKKS